MKKIIILLLAVVSLVSCNEKTKDYVTLSGHFDGLLENDTLLTLRSPKINKKIVIDSNGNFKDTIKIKENNSISFSVNKNLRFSTFLKNGYDLTINGNASDILGSLTFKGKGSVSNNYLINRIRKVVEFNKQQEDLVKMDSMHFYQKITEFDNYFKKILENKNSKIDTLIINMDKKGLETYLNRLELTYKRRHAMLTTLAVGKPSPKFNDLENFKGGSTSLDDFKGKFVYIDVWATWCRPCLGQIPSLKELEKEYRDKPIEFVSISTDKPEKHEAWINMIKSKGMEGTQLFAGTNLDFQRAYQINSIPRFIFIGKNGEILNPNAPRPSDKEAVKAMFEKNGLK